MIGGIASASPRGVWLTGEMLLMLVKVIEPHVTCCATVERSGYGTLSEAVSCSPGSEGVEVLRDYTSRDVIV